MVPLSGPIKAFEDTWRWDRAAAHAYQQVVRREGRFPKPCKPSTTFLGETECSPTSL